MTFAPMDRVRPGENNPRGSFVGTVKENRRLCTDHYRLVLRVPDFPASSPGQFVQVDCRDPHAAPAELDIEPRTFEWGAGGGTKPAVTPSDPDFISPLAFLRRPFSIADHRMAEDAAAIGRGMAEIDILHRVVGKGTSYLAQLRSGQTVSLLGPLGKGFTLPDGLKLACLVGGGVGIPPMIYLARRLRERLVDSAVAFVGAQREDLVPLTFTDAESSPQGDALLNIQEFAQYGYPAIVSTDDGSRGMKGFVTVALDRFLNERQTRQGTLEGTVIYCCGPTPMMKAAAKVAADHGVVCQLSLEQPMACGMATCQSCVIKFRDHNAPRETEWKYKLTCTEGPVFDSRDILW